MRRCQSCSERTASDVECRSGLWLCSKCAENELAPVRCSACGFVCDLAEMWRGYSVKAAFNALPHYTCETCDACTLQELYRDVEKQHELWGICSLCGRPSATDCEQVIQGLILKSLSLDSLNDPLCPTCFLYKVRDGLPRDAREDSDVDWFPEVPNELDS